MFCGFSWFNVSPGEGQGAGVVFQGETAITVDDKGRMAVPTAYRDLVARASNNRLVLTYNPFEAGCLWLYAESEWERVRDDVMSKPNTQRVVRLLQQKLVGSAAHLELVELRGRLLRFLVGRHLDEREPARAARRGVTHDAHRLDRAGLAEEFLEFRFACGVRKIPNVKPSTHHCLLVLLLCF